MTTTSCFECQRSLFEEDGVSVIQGDLQAHQHCLRCSQCSKPLVEKCFKKDNALYCKLDFFRLFGPRCDACGTAIEFNDMAIRIQPRRFFHADCFKCSECQTVLKKGQNYGLAENSVLCSSHFRECEKENKRRGPRTSINASQLEILKVAFEENSKPKRTSRQRLARETGLPIRVIQVWFQNKRSKEKRIAQMRSMVTTLKINKRNSTWTPFPSPPLMNNDLNTFSYHQEFYPHQNLNCYPSPPSNY